MTSAQSEDCRRVTKGQRSVLYPERVKRKKKKKKKSVEPAEPLVGPLLQTGGVQTSIGKTEHRVTFWINMSRKLFIVRLFPFDFGHKNLTLVF